MNVREEIKEILKEYRKIWAINYSSQVLRWDLETYMPQEGSEARAESLSELSLLLQRYTLELSPLVEKAERLKEMNDLERGIIRVLKRRLTYYSKVPPELISEIQKATTEARMVWRNAKAKSDFNIFRPSLERVLDLKKKEGEKLADGSDHYDALLDQNEEGLSRNIIDRIFSRLVPSLKRILKKAEKTELYGRHKLEWVKYDISRMRSLNEQVLRILQMPLTRFRMDVSAHPFTISFANRDVRITTRYEESNFKASIYATIHESGHALYELQVSDELSYTPLSRGVSSGMHESQSRFWENFVGRSGEFVSLLTPLIHEYLPFTKQYDQKQIYSYINSVFPSLVRVDADELTYNFHIALRYEIEKKLFQDKATVKEIPQLWADTMEDMLGVRPRNDSEGSLQDIHWSSGGFASFPNYTVGNVVAGMCWEAISKELQLGKVLSKGDVIPIKDWLKSKIHIYGSTYSPDELQRRAFGRSYDPEPLINYLAKKFS